MNTEKTYRVRCGDAQERSYLLHELTWLWRTAELPHDAEYLDSEGRWRPLNELLEPVLAEQNAREKAPRPAPPAHHFPQWCWAVALAILLLTIVIIAPNLQRRFDAWQKARAQEREGLRQEQEARKQDFIASNIVIPNMTHEEVRRIIGAPRSIKATGESDLERWIYKTQVIVFANGKVVGVESTK